MHLQDNITSLLSLITIKSPSFLVDSQRYTQRGELMAFLWTRILCLWRPHVVASWPHYTCYVAMCAGLKADMCHLPRPSLLHNDIFFWVHPPALRVVFFMQSLSLLHVLSFWHYSLVACSAAWTHLSSLFSIFSFEWLFLCSEVTLTFLFQSEPNVTQSIFKIQHVRVIYVSQSTFFFTTQISWTIYVQHLRMFFLISPIMQSLPQVWSSYLALGWALCWGATSSKSWSWEPESQPSWPWSAAGCLYSASPRCS